MNNPDIEQHKTLYISREESRSPLNIEDYFDVDKKIAKPGFKTLDGKFNWHCSCVASYVTSPCGVYFRNFLANMDKFMGTNDSTLDDKAKYTFEQCYAELTTCMKKYPSYYKSILDQYSESLQDVLNDQLT
ncbi:unnamed protein product [Mesocestoides corti]|uniref:Mitochondrial intermembrane space import and assembly protein 40 n=1 Tax=Mesocestoides corti TaxID=53468 RepID=A0A0R3U4B3_MESCO|nr:unnamed protein product [Mesocestoides corti]